MKVKYIVVSLLLVLLTFSCKKQIIPQQNSNLDYNKIIVKNSSNSLIFTGQVLSDSIPSGIWSFYDQNGDDILSIVFNNDDGLYHYTIMQNVKNKKILSTIEVLDGEIVKQEIFTDSQANNTLNGKILFEEFIKPYLSIHPEYKNILSGIVSAEKINLVFEELKNEYSDFPKLNNREMQAIYKYLNNPRIIE